MSVIRRRTKVRDDFELWRTRVPEIWLPVSLKDMGYTCLELEASSFSVSLFSF